MEKEITNKYTNEVAGSITPLDEIIAEHARSIKMLRRYGEADPTWGSYISGLEFALKAMGETKLCVM